MCANRPENLWYIVDGFGFQINYTWNDECMLVMLARRSLFFLKIIWSIRIEFASNCQISYIWSINIILPENISSCFIHFFKNISCIFVLAPMSLKAMNGVINSRALNKVLSFCLSDKITKKQNNTVLMKQLRNMIFILQIQICLVL